VVCFLLLSKDHTRRGDIVVAIAKKRVCPNFPMKAQLNEIKHFTGVRV